MKNKPILSILSAVSALAAVVCLASVICLVATSPDLHAAGVAPVMAQLQPSASTSVPIIVAAPDKPFYTSEAFWSTIFGLVAGIVAIWKNSQASTHQKINESMVLAIEQATKLPEVAAAEAKIKQAIQDKATEYGVQPVLHRIVQDLTEPAASASETPSA